MPQFFNKISRQCIIIFRFKLQSEFIVQIINENSSVNLVFIFSDTLYLRNSFLILFVNITHDLFNEIFDRYNSRKATVLIDQKRHMMPCLLHNPKQFIRFLCFRNKERLTKHLPDISFLQRMFSHLDHHIFYMKHTDNIINVFFIYRNPIMSCLKDLIDHLLKRIVNIKCYHFSPRNHDLSCSPSVKLKHRIDHLFFVIVKCTAFISHF